MIASIPVPALSGAYDFTQPVTLPLPGNGAVYFNARCTGNVIIGIATQAARTDPMYEIVIGGWGNTQSAIRRSPQGGALTTAQVGLDPNGDNWLWIGVDASTGTIKVGRGDVGTGIFMAWTDPAFMTGVQYVGFSSWDVPVNYQQISTFAYGLPQSLTLALPAQNAIYDFTNARVNLPQPGCGAVTFKVHGTTDVNICIATKQGPYPNDPVYEVVLGGWNNTLSVIRNRMQAQTNLVQVPGALLDPHGDNPLWIGVDGSTGTINVGRGTVGSGIFMSYTDPAFLKSVQYVAFSTWTQPLTYLNIQVVPYGAPAAIGPLALPARQGNYFASDGLFMFQQANSGVFAFTATGPSDAYIGIGPNPAGTNPMYEIVIGGWNNSRSVIRRAAQGAEVASANVGFKTTGEDLWVGIDNGTIRVGKGVVGSGVFMSFADPQFLSGAQYIGFSCWGSPMTYSNVQVLPGGLPAPIASIACPGNKGQYDWSNTQLRLLQQGAGAVAFVAHGTNDVTIAIAPNDTTDALYEIVIGGWGNTKSVIRRSAQGDTLVSVATGITANADNPLWVGVDASTGTILVGRGIIGSNVFMSYTDPSFMLGVQRISFSAWDSPVTYSSIQIVPYGTPRVVKSVTIDGLVIDETKVAKFAPILTFFKNPDGYEEPYYPCTMDWLLQGTALIDTRTGTLVKMNPTQQDLGTYCDHFYQLILNTDRYRGQRPVDASGDFSLPMYVAPQVDPNKQYVDLNFIFIYGFNGCQTVRVNTDVNGSFTCAFHPFAEHQGDLEQVTVRVKYDFSDVLLVRYCHHGDGSYYLPEDVDFDTSGGGKRARVAVALHSHATYNPRGCKSVDFVVLETTGIGVFVKSLDFIDTFCQDGPHWRPEAGNFIFIGQRNDGSLISDQQWVKFAGRMGLATHGGGQVTAANNVAGDFGIAGGAAAGLLAGVAVPFLGPVGGLAAAFILGAPRIGVSFDDGINIIQVESASSVQMYDLNQVRFFNAIFKIANLSKYFEGIGPTGPGPQGFIKVSQPCYTNDSAAPCYIRIGQDPSFVLSTGWSAQANAVVPIIARYNAADTSQLWYVETWANGITLINGRQNGNLLKYTGGNGVGLSASGQRDHTTLWTQGGASDGFYAIRAFKSDDANLNVDHGRLDGTGAVITYAWSGGHGNEIWQIAPAVSIDGHLSFPGAGPYAVRRNVRQNLAVNGDAPGAQPIVTWGEENRTARQLWYRVDVPAPRPRNSTAPLLLPHNQPVADAFYLVSAQTGEMLHLGDNGQMTMIGLGTMQMVLGNSVWASNVSGDRNLWTKIDGDFGFGAVRILNDAGKNLFGDLTQSVRISNWVDPYCTWRFDSMSNFSEDVYFLNAKLAPNLMLSIDPANPMGPTKMLPTNPYDEGQHWIRHGFFVEGSDQVGFTLVNKKTGMALASKKVGNDCVSLINPTGVDNYCVWTVGGDPIDSEFYAVRTMQDSDWNLNVFGGQAVAGANVGTYGWQGGADNEVWRFEIVHDYGVSKWEQHMYWYRCSKCQTLFQTGNGEVNTRCPTGGNHTSDSGYQFGLFHVAIPGSQDGWRWCAKCASLYYGNGNPGRCPAGGNHEHDGFSRNYSMMISNQQTALKAEPGWMWCCKCQVMFWSSLQAQSHCPANNNGPHDCTASADYALPFIGEQDHFTWCSRCQSLYHSGDGSAPCPAGGSHDTSGSANYVLNFNAAPCGSRLRARWCSQCKGIFREGVGTSSAYNTNNGVCVKGGLHQGGSSARYAIFNNDTASLLGPNSQAQWQFCDNCKLLYYAGASVGVCPASANGHVSKSRAFRLRFR